MRWFVSSAAAVLLFSGVMTAQNGHAYGSDHIWWEAGDGFVFPWEDTFEDPDGQIGVLNQAGAIPTKGHAFFEPLGMNGRACVTCHQPFNAMSISTDALKQRWAETQGEDPIFAAIDGSNCPSLPQADPRSHSLLLDRGLFRMVLPWPPKTAKPDFRIAVVSDPAGCNTDPVYGLRSAHSSVSVYRRPRMSANFWYVTEPGSGRATGIRLMADGREFSLASQAISAAFDHEQAAAPPDSGRLQQIVEFERQLFVAQSSDIRGGLLGEPRSPSVLGPDNIATARAALTLSLDAWKNPAGDRLAKLQKEFRMSAVRGREMFFGRAKCATCHNDEASRWMNIGTTNRGSARDAGELPLFKISCDDGRVLYSEDPGRALISGKCDDVGAIVAQQLRGLAARAPYFANGSARTLADVVDFYRGKFGIEFTDREREDLVNFLRVL
jgi:cytochrome c peroxidase